MNTTTLNIQDLHDWFLDKAGGISLELLDQNVELGIKLSDSLRNHTMFLYHGAKIAAKWESEKQTSARGLTVSEREKAKDAMRRHLRAWTNKAFKLNEMAPPWVIPHSLAAFEMLHVRPPSKYVGFCQRKALAGIRRCGKGDILEWFSAGSALTLEFEPKFIQALCDQTISLAPSMRGYELFLIAHKMAIMDAVTVARTGQKSAELHKAYGRIFDNGAIQSKMDADMGPNERRMLADSKFWFNKDRRSKLPREPEQHSPLEYLVSEKFKEAGAVPTRRRIVKDVGHELDLSYRFNDCNFDVEVDGSEHFIRCTDGHVITLNGSTIYQSLLMREKDREQKLVRLPYTVYDDHKGTPAVWAGLCSQIEGAPAGAYIADSKGMLSANLLTQCSVKKAAPAPAKN